MARRGFFAELQHQAKVAAREQARAMREEESARNAAIREAERARKAAERAAAQLARATEAEHKRLAKEAHEAHVAAMEAEVERRNLELTQVYQEIDSLLAATLEVDDYVDLDTLRAVVEHPPFDRVDLETPTPSPSPILNPPKPVFISPPTPRGFLGIFGKKRYAKALAEATDAHERAIAAWQAELVQIESARKITANRLAEMEARRVSTLEMERARYTEECATREAEAAEHNKAIDTLIANLGYGTVSAVEEYVSIVLSNSVYPVHFPVEHDFVFDATTAELRAEAKISSRGSEFSATLELAFTT